MSTFADHLQLSGTLCNILLYAVLEHANKNSNGFDVFSRPKFGL